jgi:hypothetical protein
MCHFAADRMHVICHGLLQEYDRVEVVKDVVGLFYVGRIGKYVRIFP